MWQNHRKLTLPTTGATLALGLGACDPRCEARPDAPVTWTQMPRVPHGGLGQPSSPLCAPIRSAHRAFLRQRGAPLRHLAARGSPNERVCSLDLGLALPLTFGR